MEYGVRAFPVGAFVRMIGMNNLDDPEPGDEQRAFRNKSYPRRLLTITAGSLMHMLIAIVLLLTVYSVWGERIGSGVVSIAETHPDGPAFAAGIRQGDRLIEIDGLIIDDANNVPKVIQANAPGDTVEVLVDRNGEQITLAVSLGTHPDRKNDVAYLGISPEEPMMWSEVSTLNTVSRSVTDLGSAMWQSVGGAVKVMNPVNVINHLTGADNDPTTQPVTALGVSRASGWIGEQAGLAGILVTLAGVNVFVGLINMFPLLPFDGGHAAIATYERLRSRRGTVYRADVAKMIPVAMAVMGLLMFIMISGLYLDFTKPIR